MKRAALYVRVSSQGQVRDGYSLQFQEQILRDFCQRESMVVAEVYREEGQSGSTTARTELQRLIEDARQGRFDIVLIFRVDRFSRDPVDLLALVRELETRSIKLRSVTESVDAGDPAGELMLTMLGAIGKFVRTNIIQNAMLGKTKRAESGRYTGGKLPFGYALAENGSYVPDPHPWWNGASAGEVARMIFDLYLTCASRGQGCSTVAQYLEELQVPPPMKGWRKGSIYQILKNPAYAGDFAWRKRSQQLNKPSTANPREKWVLASDAHEPIVDRATWERVQRVLKEQRTSTGQKPDKPDTLLTGFVRCGECQAALTPHQTKYRGEPVLYFTCGSKLNESRKKARTACTDFPYFRADELEPLVWNALVGLVTVPERIEVYRARMRHQSGPELAETEAEAKRLEKRLQSIEDQETLITTKFTEGHLREDLWKRQLERLGSERDGLLGRLTQLHDRIAERRGQTPTSATTEEIRAYLKRVLTDTSTVEQRREALALLVGFRGVSVHKDGNVEFDLKIPTQGVDAPSLVNSFVASKPNSRR